MKLFARLEVSYDNSEREDDIERLVSGDVDLALWLRGIVETLEREHGSSWEAELHLEPLTESEE
jgi:hypothetical protein